MLKHTTSKAYFIRGAATKSWPWILGSHFFIFGPIELIFQYVGANVC